MDKISVSNTVDGLSSDPALYNEILRVRSLSAGIYKLEAGAQDPQEPHTEDEVYYVISGRGKFFNNGKAQDIISGDLIFVQANAEHRFFDVEEKLILLVIFAPAENQAGE